MDSIERFNDESIESTQRSSYQTNQIDVTDDRNIGNNHRSLGDDNQIIQRNRSRESINLCLELNNIQETMVQTSFDETRFIRSVLPTGNYTTKIKRGTNNHVGTKIETSSLTIINNAQNELISEQQNITVTNSNRGNLFSNLKNYFKYLLLITLVFIGCYKIITYEMTKEIKSEVSDTMNKTVKGILTTDEFSIPEPWFINRTGWNASAANTNHCLVGHKVSSIIILEMNNICNTIVTCTKALQNIQYEHKKKLEYSGDIDYNFVVGGDGRIYEGRGWERCNGHYIYSTQFIMIAFTGNYSCSNNDTSFKTISLQFKALELFINTSMIDKKFSMGRNILSNYNVIPACCGNTIKNGGGLIHEYVLKTTAYSAWKRCLSKINCYKTKC